MKRNGKKLPVQEIRCQQCDAVLSMRRDLKRRAVRGHNGVTELGLQCWRCKRWVHVYFDGPSLTGPRKRYRKAQRRAISTKLPDDEQRALEEHAAYIAAFNALNDEMRGRLGISERVYAGEGEEDE